MRPILVILSFAMILSIAVGDDAEDAMKAAKAALKKGDGEAALKAATKAVDLNPKSAEAIFYRGEAYALQRKHKEAIADYEKALTLDKELAIAYDRRGSEQFKLGKIKESIEDFDTFIKMQPKAEESHWKRGISYYYAGKFKEGAAQFKLGEKVYGNDVENAFWHYLCNARADGIEKARNGLLKIGTDSRIPMMKVYDLIKGSAKAEDVIGIAEKAKLDGEDKNEALFYAHLYVALNYEAEKDAKKCLAHLKEAVEKHKIGHYMWDVANVHLQSLKK